MIALYAEEATFQRYETLKDLRKLTTVALLGPLIFHPFTVYAAIKGNWEKIREIKAGEK